MTTIRKLQLEIGLMVVTALVLGVIYGFGGFTHAQQPRPRFELVLTEDHHMGTDFSDSENNGVAQWQVWHDRETGQEIVCASSFISTTAQAHNSLSCFPTGRDW